MTISESWPGLVKPAYDHEGGDLQRSGVHTRIARMHNKNDCVSTLDDYPTDRKPLNRGHSLADSRSDHHPGCNVGSTMRLATNEKHMWGSGCSEP